MRRLQQDLLVVVERVMSESTYEQGKVGKKGMAGIFGDKLGSRWEEGGFGLEGLFGGEDNDLVLGN